MSIVTRPRVDPLYSKYLESSSPAESVPSVDRRREVRQSRPPALHLRLERVIAHASFCPGLLLQVDAYRGFLTRVRPQGHVACGQRLPIGGKGPCGHGYWRPHSRTGDLDHAIANDLAGIGCS